MTDIAYAEDAVLNGTMANNDAFHDISAFIGVDQFTNPFRKRLWAAIQSRILSGEPADMVTLMESLPEDADKIHDLFTTMAHGSSVKTYAEIVRGNWRRRQAGQIAQDLMRGSRESDDGAIDAAIASLLALNADVACHEYTGKQSMVMAWEMAQKAYENGGVLPGITTGLQGLDSILGGWHDSDLTILGARPAMGKTAMLLNFAESACAAGFPVGLVSAEQPAIQIGARRMALTSTVGARTIRTGNFEDEDWPKMTTAMREAKDRPMWIYDRSAVTLDELIGIARKWKHNHGIRALFIDYAQRITVKGVGRVDEVSQVARGLKNLARDLNIPVIVLAQVVKGVESRDNKRPHAGDLANSDELTREADQILMLYRDEVYNDKSPDRGTAELLIEKNRHGPIGFKRFAFLPEIMAFRDLDERF